MSYYAFDVINHVVTAAEAAAGLYVYVLPFAYEKEIEIVEICALNSMGFTHIQIGYTRKFSDAPQGRYHILKDEWQTDILNRIAWNGSLKVKADGLMCRFIPVYENDVLNIDGVYRE